MKRLTPLFIILALAPLSSPGAVTLETGNEDPAAANAANPGQDALDAFNKGRHFEAVRLAKPLAEAGNPEALLIMGLSHETGRGAEPSRELAIEFLRKAQTAGNSQAAYRLARLLVDQGGKEGQEEARKILEKLAKDDGGAASRLLGEGSLRGWFGGEADFDQARSWWAASAEKGDITAILALARLLDGNFGFPEKRDPAAALKLFLQAAELDNPAAMVAAGSRLLNGDEKIRDEKLGREWLAKAIEKEQIDSYLALGDFEEMIKKDDKAALAQYQKGAEAGQSGCMLKLAAFLTEGRAGQEKNPDEALTWFKKAGEAGNALGHVQAAAILLKGEGLQIVEGYSQLVAAAEAGLVDIQNEVGLLYLSGRLGVRDATAAAGWFSRASAGGYPQSSHNLATLYDQGVGVPRNPSQAGRLYTQAANAGHPQATTALGRLVAQGLGTVQDLPKAWALFSLAVERGDNEAKAPLGELTSQLTEEQVAKGRLVLAEFKADPKIQPKDQPKETPKDDAKTPAP